MRWRTWWFIVSALAPNAQALASRDHKNLRRARGSAFTAGAQPKRSPLAFLPPRGPLLSCWLSSPAPSACSPSGSSLAARSRYHRRHRHRSNAWLPPPSSSARPTREKQQRSSALAMSGIVLPSDDARNGSNSPVLQAGGTGGDGGDGGRIALWLDMRTAVLPAGQTLMSLYDDLRRREEALGRGPEDPDWSLSRVPNPVGALFYAAEPPERAAEEIKALGGGALPCFRLSGTDEGTVLEASSGGIVGVALDPAGGGGGAGGSPAAEVVAEAQKGDRGGLVLLGGVRPSVWEGRDIATLVRIAASTCDGAGKTLVVTVRSVGQLHDAAMAAFAASQTQVLGGGRSQEGGGDDGDNEEGCKPVVLLIEPIPELWEAGLLYL